MADEEKKDDDLDKDPDLVMVGDGVEEGDQKIVDEDKDEDKDKDKDKDDDDDGDGGHADDDRRAGHGEADEDDKKELKRLENKSRRQRQKEARERDKRELTFLRSRNEQVERQLGELATRQTKTEVSQIDQRINQLKTAIRSADDVYAKAIDANEGKDAAEANKIRGELQKQIDGLEIYKEQASAAPDKDEAPDPALVDNVRNWHSKNKWFDFGRRDEDSAIAGAIDDMMVRDGWDPRVSEYYDELSKRIARRLPHLAKKGGGNGADDRDDDDDDDDRDRDKARDDDRRGKRKPSGPKFRVGGKERTLKSNEVHISKERREAMEEAGVWEDPVLRKKYLKRYADWDREQAENRA